MPTNEERLKTYGLKPTDVTLKDLVVPAGQTVVLDKSSTAGQFKELKTKSFATLKQWIGMTDKLVKDHPQILSRASMKPAVPMNIVTMLRPADPAGSPSLPARFTPTLKADARVLAKKYLFDDSSKISNAAAVLEKAFGKIDLGFYILRSIEVKAGAVLEISKDVQILYAHKLKIHDGGKVKVHLGNTFKVDVAILEKV